MPWDRLCIHGTASREHCSDCTEMACAEARLLAIEECAKVAEDAHIRDDRHDISAAIRALAAPTPGRLFEAARAMPSSVLVSPTPLAPTTGVEPKCNCTGYGAFHDNPCPVHDAQPQRTPEGESK